MSVLLPRPVRGAPRYGAVENDDLVTGGHTLPLERPRLVHHALPVYEEVPALSADTAARAHGHLHAPRAARDHGHPSPSCSVSAPSSPAAVCRGA
jgi:hypothetical protein